MNSKLTQNSNKIKSDKKPASADTRLDEALTLTLAQASIEAYNDFLIPNYTPNLDGYTFVARFTGWDTVFLKTGSEEKFGLIFKSQTVADQYIVAFRGTASDLDVLEDLFVDYTTFMPYLNTITPTPNDVADGFYGIYTKKGGLMTQTMQQQVFDLLSAQTISQLYITGHSLGGALSQLFTLDMCVSLPNINIQTINFASPKVGGPNWSSACAAVGATQKIMRVTNFWDLIPYYPISISDPDKYVSIGSEFQTAFSGSDYITHISACHHLQNYQLVLKNCLPLNPQIWFGQFDDAFDKTYVMTSTAPPDASIDKMLAKLRELKDIENSIREADSRTEPYIQC